MGFWYSGSKMIIGSFLDFEKYWVFLGFWEEEGDGVDWVKFLGKGGKSWVETGVEGVLGVEPTIWRKEGEGLKAGEGEEGARIWNLFEGDE